MPYIVAFLVFCAFFAAFAAGRKNRSRVLWWLIGLTVVGAVAIALLPAAPPREGEAEGRRGKPARPPRRPRRCRGRYIPDCQGCPYFRRPLFTDHPPENLKGQCTYFGEDLLEENNIRGPEET